MVSLSPLQHVKVRSSANQRANMPHPLEPKEKDRVDIVKSRDAPYDRLQELRQQKTALDPT